ncbi:YidB family protein [Embleya sp. NPDC005971]|uniref:YidB family protein n=1 Tax=Embleya sp. NPDC005971 TaxID=3156724 RepID=UPI0034036AA4
MSGGGMGLPGGLGGLLGGILGGRGGSGHQGLVRVVLGMLTKQGGSGGLGALLNKLQEGGLGEQTKSWVDTGRNQPVSGKEITDALGEDEMVRLAGQAGMTKEETAAALAATLPGVVDAVTPEGEVPAAEQIDALIDPEAAPASGASGGSAGEAEQAEAGEAEAVDEDAPEDEAVADADADADADAETESGSEPEAEAEVKPEERA